MFEEGHIVSYKARLEKAFLKMLVSYCKFDIMDCFFHKNVTQSMKLKGNRRLFDFELFHRHNLIINLTDYNMLFI